MAKKSTPKKVAKREQSTKASETLTVEQAYEIAVKQFKNNELQQAELLCREILKVAPNYSSALDMLGVITAKAGKLDEAEELIKKAIEIAPHEQNYRRNLAVVHRYKRKLLKNNEDVSENEQNKYSEYAAWIKLYDSLTDTTLFEMKSLLNSWHSPPLISIVMPTYNTRADWLREAIESVINQIYPHWEFCIADDASTLPQVREILQEYADQDKRIKVYFRETNGHISTSSNDALALATGDYIALLDHDDVLPIYALFFVAEAIINHPELVLIYSDEDKLDEDGQRCEPYFKCDWNPDLFLSHNLITHLGVYKTDIVRKMGGFRIGFEGAQDYDLALRIIERIHDRQIYHIPHVLYHWRMHENSTSIGMNAKFYALGAGRNAIAEHLVRCHIQATVEENYSLFGTYRVKCQLPVQPPLVSLIIPTRNQAQLLRMCVGSLLEKTNYKNFEVIIVDNQTDDPETLTYLDYLQEKKHVCVLKYPYPFNYSAINNMAVKQANGEIIGLLNNDIEVINENWLTEMVSHALRPEIGAVGARLWYGNNKLQHGGVILGLGGVAGHAHKHFARGNLGYAGRMALIQNFSAVTGACMVMRKEVFLSVDGLNETELKIAFNDVDLCLKIRALGLRNLWTPYAELYHHESVSRGYEDTPEKQARAKSEIDYMHRRWGMDTLLNDPAYSPNLTLDSENFAIAFPPRVNIQTSFKKQKYSESIKDHEACMELGKEETLTNIAPEILHRYQGYQLLSGHGLEIGALHQPSQIPDRCTIEYCDAHTKEELSQHFPELQGITLVDVTHICDLDKQGLSIIEDEMYDFVILKHVIEHVANPIKVIGELFRVTKLGGLVVISAPDKNFTFDEKREITSFTHLLTEYENNITEVTDTHYLDFLRHVHPEVFNDSQGVERHIANVRKRREHAHVWDSQAFQDFLLKSLTLLQIKAVCIFEVSGQQNYCEYFSVWRKI